MAGESVSATMSENTTEKEIVTANCLYICPVMPPMNPTGTKMARNTSVVAVIGAVTSFIAWMVAASGEHLSLSMMNVTRSTTTMALSTTVPITRTSPNSERMLMLYPIAASPAKVASSEIGIAATGTSVTRQS